jgi:hypothetical protein
MSCDGSDVDRAASAAQSPKASAHTAAIANEVLQAVAAYRTAVTSRSASAHQIDELCRAVVVCHQNLDAQVDLDLDDRPREAIEAEQGGAGL